MSKRKTRNSLQIKDTLAMCGLYVLLLALFFVPGIILDDRPVSALNLMCAARTGQYGAFPKSLAVAREMIAAPVLCLFGLAMTLLLRKSSGKYAFGACVSLLLFGLVGVFGARYLPQAGGFVLGAAMFLSLVLFFVSVTCAVIHR